MNEEFDETILDDEEEFKKRFKKIDRKNIPIEAINKSSQEIKKVSQPAEQIDEVIERLLQDKNALRRLKAELEKIQ